MTEDAAKALQKKIEAAGGEGEGARGVKGIWMNSHTDNQATPSSAVTPTLPSLSMWVQTIGSIAFYAALPAGFLAVLLQNTHPILRFLGFLIGLAHAVAYWIEKRDSVSPCSPKFRAAPRPMLWLYGIAILVTILYAIVCVVSAFQLHQEPQFAIAGSLAIGVTAVASILLVVSIIDSGGVNPFIDQVNLTFIGMKTYRQIREERETASAAAERGGANVERSGNAEDSGH